MPFQKPAEQGWFYHAPARVKHAEPIGVPPCSQIPGLSEAPPDQAEVHKRTLIKDTDSDYVRLAKQGGRQDLLQNRFADRGRSKEPVGYPRPDWFYLEDNRVQDEENKEKKDYNFLLPEYMVHDEYTVDTSSAASFKPKRAPYGYDRTTVFEREGDPTAKDVKLPEVVRQGYGVRTEKLKNKTTTYNMPPPPKPIRHEESTAHKTYKPIWTQKQAAHDKNAGGNQKNGDMFASEYQKGFCKRSAKAGRRATPTSQTEKDDASAQEGDFSEDGRPPPKTAAQAVKKEPEPDKELFKMSRFKNVPARTDCHRPPAVPAVN